MAETGTDRPLTYTLIDNGSAVITGLVKEPLAPSKEIGVKKGVHHLNGRPLTIPREIDGHPVVGIGDEAFSREDDLGSVTLPDGILWIGKKAFEGSNLTQINLPESLLAIDDSAFTSTNLKSVLLPSGLVTMGVNPFAACKRLEGIFVEEGNCRFRSEKGILFDSSTHTLLWYPYSSEREHYEVPDGTEIIGPFAFYTSDVVSVVLPNSVHTLEEQCFAFCSQLTSLEMHYRMREFGPMILTGTSWNTGFQLTLWNDQSMSADTFLVKNWAQENGIQAFVK